MLERLELEIIVEQIAALKSSIGRLEKAICEEANKLEGFANLVSVTGIGAPSAGVLLSVIGKIDDFADENKLASYFGIVPKVHNSADSVKTGRITKRGSKAGRTCLVQCTLVAIRYSPYVKLPQLVQIRLQFPG